MTDTPATGTPATGTPATDMPATGPVTGTSRAGTPLPAPASTRARIPFRRLLGVEARKLVDTRSGKIMTALMVALIPVSVTARGFVTDPDLYTLAGTAGIGLAILLPVLGILTVTGEWSHRTALVTFALEPRRSRVLAAKCLPPLIVAALASPFSLLVAVPVTAVVAGVRDLPATWEVAPTALLGWMTTNVLVVAAGLALGMLLLNGPAAIVICLAMPMAWSLVGELGSTGRLLADWLDVNRAASPLVDGHLTGGDAARLATSALVWIVVPAIAGTVRVGRKEIT
ncbi:ABC transporter permease [Streptosporangium sp. DT93]|uniref:ABC transporter permease n=1 Tax=Streptosporangium sp. DT93 TaxID=3393428 RepID=UPI003CEA3C76